MSETERRILADITAARSAAGVGTSVQRLIDEQRSVQRMLDEQKAITRMIDSHSLGAFALSQQSALARTAALRGTEMHQALERMRRNEVPRTLTDAVALAATLPPSWMTHAATLRQLSLSAFSATASSMLANQGSVLARLNADFAAYRPLHESLLQAAALQQFSPTWHQRMGLEAAAFLTAGLERGWRSSTLATALAPSAAVAGFAEELAQDLKEENPAAVQALNLATEAAEEATFAATELADVLPTVVGEPTPEGVQASLTVEVQRPLLLYRAFHIEVIGADGSVAGPIARQAQAFRTVAHLIIACRRAALTLHGGDLFSTSPDVQDAQVRIATASVYDAPSANETLAAFYLVLHEAPDKKALKAFALAGAEEPGWLDLLELTSVLRNNMGGLHAREDVGRYESERKWLSRMSIARPPVLPAEWIKFGDRLALAAVQYFSSLRDRLEQP